VNETSLATGTHRGLYYGWKVVFALFMAGFMVYGGGLYCFVLFVPRMTAEFGWSRAATSGLFSVFWLTAPLILLGGYGIKRVGMAKLLVGGILIEGVCVIVLAGLSSLWEMYAVRILMGLGKVMFAVTLPYAISKWFSTRFSLALGLTWAGWHTGGLILSPLVAIIIEHYSWRTACLAIGAGLLTIGLIPILIALRVRSPQELGVGLDGEPLDTRGTGAKPVSAPAADTQKSAAPDSPQGSLGAVLRAPMFWLICVVTVLYYSTYGGLLAHEAAVVESAGFAPQLASLILGSTAGFAAVTGLIGGWILDRYSIRAVGVGVHIALLVGAVALLGAAQLHATAALVAYAITFGTAIGVSDLYFVALLRNRFSTVNVAYIYSAWYCCELSTLTIAPIAAGKVFDLTGNYGATLALLAVCGALAFLVNLAVTRPTSAAPALAPR
jgi:MFS family permease